MSVVRNRGGADLRGGGDPYGTGISGGWLGRALRETPTVELRLDWLASDTERQKALDWLKKFAPKKAVFLATCRRRVGGGELAGGAEAELYWLRKANEAGCAWCDLEIETLRELPGKTVECVDCREGIAVHP